MAFSFKSSAGTWAERIISWPTYKIVWHSHPPSKIAAITIHCTCVRRNFIKWQQKKGMIWDISVKFRCLIEIQVFDYRILIASCLHVDFAYKMKKIVLLYDNSCHMSVGLWLFVETSISCPHGAIFIHFQNPHLTVVGDQSLQWWEIL